MELMTAITVAVLAHDGQLDKIGMPYILHPLAVMESFPLHDTECRIVAVLHDTLEDTDCTLASLEAAGMSKRVCMAVEAITKRPGETLTTYYRRVKRNRVTLQVKLKDIAHNLSARRMHFLPRLDQVRLKEKYRVALIALGE